MPPSRGICLAGHGLRRIRPIPPRLQGTRQISHRNAPSLFSRTPSRPVQSFPPSLAAIGHRNISLWPFSKSEQGLGFTPAPNATREGTPEPAKVSESQNDAAASASTPAPSSTPQSPAEPFLDATPLPLDSADEAQSLLDAIQSAPITEDHIGFMKEMGIQYGFPYFTNSMQFLIEHIHVYAGTEWWATIVLSAITVRALMSIPFAVGSHHTAKMQVIAPYVKDAKERYQQAKETKDLALQQEVQKEMLGLNKAVGVKVTWIFAPMVIQGIAGFAAFKLLRAMALLPVPGLETGGLLWIQDLTVADPTFAVPLAMGAILHMIVRLGGEMGQSQEVAPSMRKLMLYVMPAVMTGFTAFQPAALQLSFLAAMLWGSGQAYFFRQIWFRNFFKMDLLQSQLNKGNNSGHKAASTIAADAKVKVAAAKSSKSGPGRLRTVSAQPLRYEAPRARASREMAAFRAPPIESQVSETVPKAKGGVFDGLRAQARELQKDFEDGKKKWVGDNKPESPREKRAKEYEKRRKVEKKDEAEMRRQGRGY